MNGLSPKNLELLSRLKVVVKYPKIFNLRLETGKNKVYNITVFHVSTIISKNIIIVFDFFLCLYQDWNVRILCWTLPPILRLIRCYVWEKSVLCIPIHPIDCFLHPSVWICWHCCSQLVEELGMSDSFTNFYFFTSIMLQYSIHYSQHHMLHQKLKFGSGEFC